MMEAYLILLAAIFFTLLVLFIIGTLSAMVLAYLGLTNEFRNWMISKFIREKKND